MDLFTSFFSAIDTFIHEMLKKKEKNLEKIVIGGLVINISSLGDSKVQYVTVTDPEDQKHIKKFSERLEKHLLIHKNELEEWDGNAQKMKFMDAEIHDLVNEFKLVDFNAPPSTGTLTKEERKFEKQKQILDSLWKGNL